MARNTNSAQLEICGFDEKGICVSESFIAVAIPVMGQSKLPSNANDKAISHIWRSHEYVVAMPGATLKPGREN